MFKNVAGQKIAFYAHDASANAPKTGDSVNLTAYVSKDGGAAATLTDVSATELDSTNAKGVYYFDVAQAESNADLLVFSAKSATANVQIDPLIIFTTPSGFTALTTSAIATQTELQIMDETDSRTVLQAIVDKINAADANLAGLTLSAIAQAVWRDATSGDFTGAGSAGAKLFLLGTNGMDSPNAVTTQTTISSIQATISTLFAGMTSVGNWLRAIVRKTAPDATALSEINAPTNSLSGTYSSADSTQAIRERGDVAWLTGSGGGSNGSGAFSVTVTVTDGTAPIQGASVRIGATGDPAVNTTDASGVAGFSRDAKTFTVSATFPDYTFTPATHVLQSDGTWDNTGSSNLPITMAPASGDPTKCDMSTTLRDGQGNPLPNTKVYLQLTEPPAGSTDSWSRTEFFITSNSSGVLSADLPRTAVFLAHQASGQMITVVVPDAASGRFPNIPSAPNA